MLISIDGKLFNSLLITLKCVYGLVPILLGVDKLFFYYIVNWNKYVSPFVAAHVPLTVTHIVIIVGILEIIAGLIVLSPWTRLGAYLVASLTMIIVINLFAIGGLLDIILRDLVLVVGYITYAMLIQVKETARPA